MKPTPLAGDGARRLEEIGKYGLVTALANPALDDLAALAAHMCDAPISLISLVDEKRERFVAKIGWPAVETAHEISFGGQTILEPDLLLVPDCKKDQRFSDNPLVKGDPFIRFYAGVPLVSPYGQAIGALCIMDYAPRELNGSQQKALRMLGRQVISQFELRRQAFQLAAGEERLRLVTDNARVGLVIVGADRRYLYANDAYAEILDLKSSAIVGQRVSEVLAAVYEEQIRPRLDRAFAGNRVTYDLCKPTASGDHYYAVRYEPTIESGAVTLVVVVITDITERKQAESDRHEALRFAQSTIDALGDHLCVLDETGKILATNEAWRRFAEANPSTAGRARASENYLQVCDAAIGVGAAGAAAFAQGIRSVLSGELMEYAQEYSCPSPTEERWFFGRISRFSDDGPVRVVVAHENITARRHAEMESLRLAAIVSSSDDAIIGKNLKSIITNWNRGAERIFGYTAAEMVGRSIMCLIPADRQEEENHILRKIGAGESVEHFETLRQTKNGRLIHVSVTASPIRDADGKVIGVSKVARDISERKRAEQTLRASEARYRRLFESTKDGILILDADTGMIADANPFLTELLNYSHAELLGRFLWEIGPLKDIIENQEAFRKLQEDRYISHEKLPLETKGGHSIWVEFVSNAYEVSGKQVVQCNLRDITARAQVEAKLAEERNLLRTLIDCMPDAIFTKDLQGRWGISNEAHVRLAGVATEAELFGKTVFDLYPPELAETYAREDGEVFASGKPILNREEPSVSREGENRYLMTTKVPLRNPKGELVGLLGVIRDITERKEAELALRESEGRFRQLAANINEVFWIIDQTKNQILYVSPAYESIWGRSCESLYEAPRTWLEAIHPEDRQRILQAASTKQIRGDYNETYRIQRPDGSVRWIRDRAFPIRDATGEVHRIAGTAEDITEQRQLEEQFRQAQKMEGIGQLAGGVAHDFNNILAAMMMQTELAASCEGVPADADEYLSDIKACVERAASLTRQLLAFSRRQVMQMRRLDMNEIVTNLLKMLRRVVGEDVALKLELNPTPLLVQADAGMLDQVLLNLVVNARDAMPRGGRLIIATTERMIEEKEAGANPEAGTGRQICLRVSDTGSGIDATVLPHIFEPFFTTKEVGKGTGLGLATVFGIVKQHRGLIQVSSQAGVGTTFEILLPADPDSIGDVPKQGNPLRVLTGTETILLVEDDSALRESMRRLLERQGYRVLAAGNGHEALEIWDERDGRVDLLLTDFVMPGGLTGLELAARLQEHAPTLKVIFTSGYSAELAGRELKLQEGQNFLPKPCVPEKLLETIRRILDSEN